MQGRGIVRRDAGQLRAGQRLNTLGMNERTLDAMLDILDTAAQPGGASKRAFVRWPFRQTSVKVSLMHPGGSTVTLKLACRNLSRTGIGLLHGCFVHPGTAAHLELPTLQGGATTLPGIVRRCSHRRGVMHELGIEFTRPIDLSLYVVPNANALVSAPENADPKSLSGQVLLLTCDADTGATVDHFLRETAVRVTRVASAADFLKVADNRFDVFILDMHTKDLEPRELIARLRRQGLRAPMVAFAAGSPVEMGRMLEREVAIVPKPLSQHVLLRVLAERLGLSGNMRPSSPPPGTIPAATRT